MHNAQSHSDSQTDALIGKSLANRFKILAKQGSGSYGAVYKAKSESLDVLVALKIINSSVLGDSAALARVKQEAKALGSLNHPNIPKIYAVCAVLDGQIALACEFAHGNTLAEEIANNGPLAPERLRMLFAQVADALEYAHSHGFVHRDIKPSNIMLCPKDDGSEIVKLLDFGLAKQLASENQRLTRTGTIVGTPAYMSPEQFQGQPLTATSDIYSLGCTIYEAATGQPPFSGDSPYAIAYSHFNSNIPPITAPALQSINGIIAKATAKDPALRYQSAEALKSDLLNEPRRVGPTRPLEPAASTKSSFFRRLVVATASLIAVIVLGGIAAFMPHISKNPDAQEILKQMRADPKHAASYENAFERALAGLPRYSQQRLHEEAAVACESNQELAEKHMRSAYDFSLRTGDSLNHNTNLLVSFYWQRKQFEKAEVALRDAICLDIARHETREACWLKAKLAENYGLQGKFEKSIATAKGILAIDPQLGGKCNSIGTIALCNAWQRSGKYKSALRLADDWLAVQTGDNYQNAMAHKVRAICLNVLGDHNAARSEASQALAFACKDGNSTLQTVANELQNSRL